MTRFAGTLLPEHLELVQRERDEWMRVALSIERCDRDAAVTAVRSAYQTAGLNPPKIVIWMDSPLGGAFATTALVQLGGQLRDQLGVQLGDQLRGQLRDQLGDQLGDQLWGEAVQATGKQGTLTLTVKVKPAGKGDHGTVLVADTVAVKMPQAERGEAIFFADDDHNLVRHNPAQQQLPLREVPKPSEAKEATF